MAIDRAKLAKSAQKHLAKGNLDRAIADYEKLAEDDPSDLRTLLKLGDLYTKQGSLRAAAETYRKVASQYAEQGFFLKAVAVFKQILKLDPEQTDLVVKLGEMYELLSLTSDAIAAYEQAAETYTRGGKQYKALVPLSKIEKLDPHNVAACIRYAEALSTARRTDEAIEAFSRGAALLKEQGRMDDYVKVAERLLYHQPGNLKLNRELAEMYLDRDEPKHALAKLQVCFKARPTDIDVLTQLARAFAALGQYDKVVSVHREIGRIHGEAGRISEQADAMRAILSFDPTNQEAQRVLAQVQDSVVSTSPVRGADHESDEEEDLVIIDDSEELEPVPAPQMQSHAPEELDEEEQISAQVADLMAEYEIFARYGLEEKVEAQLLAVLALMPSHLEARIKLAEYYASNDRGVEAAEQLVAAAEGVLEQGLDPTLATEYCAFAVQYDPDNGRAAELRRELEQSGAIGHEADIDVELEDEDDEEFVFIDDEVEDAEDEETDALPEVRESNPDSSPRLRGVAARDDQSGVTVLESDSTLEGGSPTVDSWMAEQEAPAHDFAINLSAAPPARDERNVPTAEFERRSSSDSNVTIPPPPGALPAELMDVLEEYDFFISQGMDDEAAEILSEALESYPDHPELLARLFRASSRAEAPVRKDREEAVTLDMGGGSDVAAEASPETADDRGPAVDEALPEKAVSATGADTVEDDEESGEVPTSVVSKLPSEPVAVVNDDMSFALAEKLAMDRMSSIPPAPGSAALSLGDVLEQFREGVRQSVDRTDSATHYDLGIAYMEMGLHVEAIEEFTLCLEDDKRKRQALTMIGLSHVAKGDMIEGIRFFESALSNDPGDREKMDLWFEIGNALELLEENDQALQYYERVQSNDAQYRQVSVRIERLRQPRSPQEEDEDFDAMFDNLILKE